jgi:hypothetical protein
MNLTRLSKLQKWIPLAAYDKIEHPESPKTDEPPPRERTLTFNGWGWIDQRTHSREIAEWRMRRGPERELNRHEVLMRYFGFAERGPRAWPNKSPIIDRRGKHAAFNAANASLSRALKRLTERGLLRDGSYSGTITLKNEGIEVARELKRLYSGEFA